MCHHQFLSIVSLLLYKRVGLWSVDLITVLYAADQLNWVCEMWSDTYSERNTVQYEKKKKMYLIMAYSLRVVMKKKKQNPTMSQINCF